MRVCVEEVAIHNLFTLWIVFHSGLSFMNVNYRVLAALERCPSRVASCIFPLIPWHQGSLDKGKKLVCSVNFVKGPQMPGLLLIFSDLVAWGDWDFGTGAYKIPLALLPTCIQAPVSTKSAELLCLLKMLLAHNSHSPLGLQFSSLSLKPSWNPACLTHCRN